jgi:hypothetical protein
MTILSTVDPTYVYDETFERVSREVFDAGARAYNEETAPSRRIRDEALDAITRARDEAIEAARRARDEAIATAQRERDEAAQPDMDAYNRAVAQARAAFYEAKDFAWRVYRADWDETCSAYNVAVDHLRRAHLAAVHPALDKALAAARLT